MLCTEGTLVENALQTGCGQQNVWTEVLRDPDWFEPSKGLFGAGEVGRSFILFSQDWHFILLFIPGGEQLSLELFEALQVWFLVCLLDIPSPAGRTE